VVELAKLHGLFAFRFLMLASFYFFVWFYAIDKGLGRLPQCNQELLVVKDKVRWAWGEQFRGMWYFSPSVMWHSWLGNRKASGL